MFNNLVYLLANFTLELTAVYIEQTIIEDLTQFCKKGNIWGKLMICCNVVEVFDIGLPTHNHTQY